MIHYYITEADLGRLRRRHHVMATNDISQAQVIPFKCGAVLRHGLGPRLRLEWGDLAKLARGDRLKSALYTLRVKKECDRAREARLRKARKALYTDKGKETYISGRHMRTRKKVADGRPG